MEHIREGRFTGERALFKARDLHIEASVFEDGESPLKESANIEVADSVFRWKYPFWYARDVRVSGSVFLEMARAGIWYTRGVSLQDCTYEAPKGLRRCRDVSVARTDFANASETLWSCEGVRLEDVSARGDYFAMGSSDLEVRNFHLTGNYSFDGCRRVRMERARMLSKDAFWNCEDVVVRDSFITGEYVGWNSRNLTFENCTIESLQGFCYIDGLTLRNCRLVNTTLSFEYCTGVDAQVTTVVDSVKNPSGGRIEARGIRELIWDDPERSDPSATELVLGE